MGCACAAPFEEAALLDEVRSALPYSAIDAETFARVIEFVSTGGYALRAYDKFKKILREKDSHWRVAHPKFIGQHRYSAGIIVDVPMLNVRFGNGRNLGKVEENFAATLSPGSSFTFAGMALEVVSIKDMGPDVRLQKKPRRYPATWGRGCRLPRIWQAAFAPY